jgi:streptogramin lyase
MRPMFSRFGRGLAPTALGLWLVACSAESGTDVDPTPESDTPGSDDAVAADADVESPDVPLPPQCIDNDDDGYGEGCDLGLDCNDLNADVNPAATEACGDAFDNNCDERVDEGCVCVEGTVETCYEGDPDVRGLGACQDGFRTCLDAEWTICDNRFPTTEVCDGVDNDCNGLVDDGVSNACGGCGLEPVELCGDFLDNDCNGFIDDAEGCTCGGRSNQPCYSGRIETLGYGVCQGGVSSCVDDVFDACLGEVLPTGEVCDGLDNDCDGFTDEGLANSCGVCGAPEVVEVCDGEDNDCDGEVDEGLVNRCGTCDTDSLVEACGDGLDNDCNGLIDEGCSCADGEPSCWPGRPDQRNVGVCRPGLRSCDVSGEFWSECEGFILPSVEVCDGLDNDCDGLVDEANGGCSICGADTEVCDGVDNDCDGQIDETLRNACGQCLEDVAQEEICGALCCDAVDNDCDGLTDEGLVNVCGECDRPCFAESWSTTPEWQEGVLDGVEIDDREALRLGNRLGGLPYLWIANSGEATVSRINTDTAVEEARYPVGQSPSRTAVDFDGNVFVANRAFSGQGTVSRVNVEECEGPACVQYTAPVGPNNAVPRGIAVDADGFPWVGTYNDQSLRRLDPDNGLVLESHFVGKPVYGISIDSDGIIWFASLNIPSFTGGSLGAFDTNTNTLLGTWEIPGCSNPYGIAVDGSGNVWLGNFTCNTLVRFDRALRSFSVYANPNLERTRGVAVDGDGFVWLASYGTNRVAKFDPTTETFVGTYPVCEGPIGVGIDNGGNIWVPCYLSNNVVRLNPDGVETARVAVGLNPYSYSDLTGFQLRNFTSRRGFWTVAFDCGTPGCVFNEVTWASDEPDRAEVLANARVSDDGVLWTPWAGPFSGGSADLSGLPTGRYIEIEMLLRTADRTITPLLERVELFWSRP